MRFNLRYLFLAFTIAICNPAYCEQSDTIDRPKANFKVLFSNDTTNIGTCESPYHKAKQPVTIDMLKATVEETAGTGIDVHMLQPGFTWVPLWQSKVLKPQDHKKWWAQYSGNIRPNDYLALVYEGHDFVDTFVNSCKDDKLAPFISLRLNDGHALENIDEPKRNNDIQLCKFYVEHPEYRIGADKNDWNQHVQNWAIPEVREYKFAFIKEICENYDISGLELDYLRFPNFFRLYETPELERKQIMTDFIKDVRKVLDDTAKEGQYRWLCVRISEHMATFDKLGIDLRAFADAGVDMFNFSGYYFTDQTGDFEKISQIIPDKAKYIELTHCSGVGKYVAKGYDNFTFRRTTDEQFYTTAHIAYSRGFDGVSAFNFVYYRKHGNGDRGEFCEPPFHIFNNIANKQWVARQKQHYYIGSFWPDPRHPGLLLPQTLKKNRTFTFFVDMAPPTGGWTKDAKLRIQADQLFGDQKVWIRYNNTELKANPDVSEPYPIPDSYKSATGTPEQYKAFTVPKEILAVGLNQIVVKMTDGDPIDLIYMDIAAE